MSDTTVRQPLTPTPLSAPQYNDLMWAHLRTREGMGGRIYTDPKGIPTMGAGIALATKGADGVFRLNDPAEIGRQISGDPNNPYKFTPAEQKLLEDTVAKLNDPTIGDDKARAAAAQKLIPPLDLGKEAATGQVVAANNKFGFTLGQDRMKDLTLGKLPQYTKSAMDDVKKAAIERGMTEQQAQAYVDRLRGSKEEAALTSLYYNGVQSPAAIKAILNGDRVRLRQEILYRSNPASNSSSQGGIADRRKAEADLATGDPSTWTPEEKARWAAIENSPEAQAYRAKFPNTFPPQQEQTPAPTATATAATNSAAAQPPADDAPASDDQAADDSGAKSTADAPDDSVPAVSGDTILGHARSVMGSGAWSPGCINDDLVGMDDKRHKYVADMLDRAGAPVPNEPDTRPTSADWADPDFDIPGWPTVDGAAQKGDVLAIKPNPPGFWDYGGGVRFATGDDTTVGVNDFGNVDESDWGFQDKQAPTVRRWDNLVDDDGKEPVGSAWF